MAATVSSPWAKPATVGSWALDSEENEAELQQQQQQKSHEEDVGPADFPSLSAAVSTKSKKKKGQTLSLAEFTTYSPAPKATFQPSFQTKGLTHEDMLALPTGPRERTAEELDRSRLGGGFRSYGMGSRNRDGEDSSNSRWGSNSRVSDDSRRNGGGFGRDSGSDMAPSRADEIDNWAAEKKSMVGSGFERKERGGGGGGGGGFFDSESKADESDNWASNKKFVPTEGRRFGGGGGGFDRERGGGFDRERRGGFESNGGGADAESWGRKREEGSGIANGGGRPAYSNGGSSDSEQWGKKKEEGGGISNGTGRPRLNLQPRTLPVSDVLPQQSPEIAAKPKGSNPFGDARPREEVLAEKGQDWKKIDEQLESMKIKEMSSGVAAIDGPGKRSFGSGKGRGSSPEERSWRKPESVDARPQSAEKVESEVTEENED